jgi:hypothetical protein
MNSILEKRNAALIKNDSDSENSHDERVSLAGSDTLTAESLSDILHPVPPIPNMKKSPIAKQTKKEFENSVIYDMNNTTAQESSLDYKHKYDVCMRILHILLADSQSTLGSDEIIRLRKALTLMLSEFSRV